MARLRGLQLVWHGRGLCRACSCGPWLLLLLLHRVWGHGQAGRRPWRLTRAAAGPGCGVLGFCAGPRGICRGLQARRLGSGDEVLQGGHLSLPPGG